MSYLYRVRYRCNDRFAEINLIRSTSDSLYLIGNIDRILNWTILTLFRMFFVKIGIYYFYFYCLFLIKFNAFEIIYQFTFSILRIYFFFFIFFGVLKVFLWLDLEKYGMRGKMNGELLFNLIKIDGFIFVESIFFMFVLIAYF